MMCELSVLDVSNVQYLPSTKSLYFVPRGSDLFCSLDPVSGTPHPPLLITLLLVIF